MKITSGGTDVTANYDVTTLPGALTITPTSQRFGVILLGSTYPYDGTPQHIAHTPTSTAASGVTTYAYSFDEAGPYAPDLARLTKEEIGAYTVFVRATNPNYEHAATTTAVLTIEAPSDRSKTKARSESRLPFRSMPTSSEISMVRLAGYDRYQTMSAIVSEGFESSEWAVLATGESAPDALASSALAGLHRCPVILTQPHTLSPEASFQLERLGVRSVAIMGGTSAVSTSVEGELASLGITSMRVAGTNRLETSFATYQALRESGSTSDTIYVTTGTVSADALGIGPLTWATSSPVLLTGGDGTLLAEAVEAVRNDPLVRNVVLVGGPASVSDAVMTQLGDGYAYTRLGGTDRYETNVLVARYATEHGLTWEHPCLTTGKTCTDALAGAALAGSRRSVLVIADSSNEVTMSLLGQEFCSLIDENVGRRSPYVYVLGGEDSVSPEVAKAL